MHETQIAAGISLVKGYVGRDDARLLMSDLLAEIALEQRSKTLYGKTVRVPRAEAWYGEMDYYGFAAAPLTHGRVKSRCLVSEPAGHGMSLNAPREQRRK